MPSTTNRKRVLEIGNYAAGYAGKLFAHAGFDVVRVETGNRKASFVSEKAMDLFLHFNKRRIATVDKQIISDLAAKADVVVLEGESASEVEAMCFGEWTTPVKVAITPFGLTGPDRNRAATNATILALGGYTNLMGDPDREPLTLPGHYVDFQTGGYAYTAAMACCLAGQSDVIDVDMLEVIMSLSQFTTVMWTCGQVVRSRHANDFWWVVPTNLFRCLDGWVYINIVPTFWDAFTSFLELPELVLDERFMTNAGRMTNRDELHEVISSVFIQWTRAEIQQRAEVARIPVGAALTFPEVLDDPHLAERRMWHEITHPSDHVVKAPRLPFVTADNEPIAHTLNEVEAPENG